MITPEKLQAVAARIAGQPLNEVVISNLRAEYPEVHFTYCMEDDIPNNEPLLEHEDFNLYLVDGREHCLCLTNNFEHATGIVVAEVIHD
ncbi:MAG: DUF6129 family protein [Methylococcales bacterium]|nr:DUF6129 family protein [Methylococcales bacterium]